MEEVLLQSLGESVFIRHGGERRVQYTTIQIIIPTNVNKSRMDSD